MGVWDDSCDGSGAGRGQPWGRPGHGALGGFGGFGGSGNAGRGGPPPWVADLVRSFGGPDLGPAQRGPKVRRGDVRAAILDMLSRDPMNGYQLIGQIAERSGGAWRPSPGSVYPTVQQLEDEGLVTGVEEGGRRVLALTEAGIRYVAEHPEEMAATWRPFEAAGAEELRRPGAGTPVELMPVIGQMMGAVWQVTTTGTEQQRAEAAEILADTRRRLYGLLADREPT